ncbi:VOC family protein [Spirosoma validum]|uniref:VOC domain-containing protein n=1 Tax=Spirosoma validum TaxID=2771355 RepID=A0A927B8C1_9BACT|nr:hypothetical protein [Spirosoma validum]MBD2757138.1 hypothetical protein [Spirosoma validum]
MKLSSSRLVVKLSISDMLKSSRFYCELLNFTFTVNENYMINSDGNFGLDSYMELDMPAAKGHFSIGLYKDIVSPLSPKPNIGSGPSFIVDNLQAALSYLQSEKVVIDSADGKIIIKNKSDEGYVDEFFFFRDPNNNSLVMRQNRTKKTLRKKA